MTIRYMEGFEYFPPEPDKEPSAFEKAFAEIFLQPSITLNDGKYFLGGEEIDPIQGEELLKKAIEEGAPYTIFEPIRRK
jgi:hypothetical protein